MVIILINHNIEDRIVAEKLTMTVQKWVFERGNYQIIVENACSFDRGLFNLHIQERIRVNGERVRDNIPFPYVVLRWRTIFEDTIIDRTGELHLKVQWRSGLNAIKARLLIDNTPVDWAEYFELEWLGAPGQWPEDATYDALPSKN